MDKTVEGPPGSGIVSSELRPPALFRPSHLFLDERSPKPFRTVFGEMLSGCTTLETAILRIRLGAVDLSAQEVSGVKRLRILVAEVSARTVEEEAYALQVDPDKEENLSRIMALLQGGRMEIRSAPLGGWSPDFSVFSGEHGPEAVIMGLHWFKRPFPHRGPAWAACFGPEEARRARQRFREIWEGAHDIGPAILKLLARGSQEVVGSPGPTGRGWRKPMAR
jgi:hypothetical protein